MFDWRVNGNAKLDAPSPLNAHRDYRAGHAERYLRGRYWGHGLMSEQHYRSAIIHFLIEEHANQSATS